MKLALRYENAQVTLTVPATGPEHPLRVVLADCGLKNSQDAPRDSGSETLALPVAFWRQIASFIERYYPSLVRAREVQRGAGEGGDEVNSSLTFELNGVAYARVKDFPRFPEFEHKGAGFRLSQRRLRVCDPCLSKVSSKSVVLDARPGKWADFVLVRDSAYGATVVAHLVLHESLPRDRVNFDAFEPVEAEAGVESGQCGFFDDAVYPDVPHPAEGGGTAFYDQACALTDGSESKELAFGSMADGAGVVSCAYPGDGRYPCGVLRDESGLVVGAMLWYAPVDTSSDETS